MIEIDVVSMKWNPYGGRMSEIADSETPFAHRGALFRIQYTDGWTGDIVAEKNLDLARFYEFRFGEAFL